ncbi:hypothetical protein [Streptomyces tropicalis]|uniref:Uncharacterized protein n=1 Tax=Streptomyces tropicalis TaxID=3034234 RepID=A0ABT6A2W7_9ACTN|nr:hypothetical protein [Streptomyces tropicalis]MDF3298988.1 hypothetical protein [Streptomyces tropicalis]
MEMHHEFTAPGGVAAPWTAEPEPLSLLRTAGLPVARRAAVAAGAVALMALLIAGVRRIRHH